MIHWRNDLLERVAHAIWEKEGRPEGRQDIHYRMAMEITPTDGSNWDGYVDGQKLFSVHHGKNSYVLFFPDGTIGCGSWDEAATLANNYVQTRDLTMIRKYDWKQPAEDWYVQRRKMREAS